MNEPIKILDHAGCRIAIFADDLAENPIKEFDCQPHVSIFSHHHDFGNDEQFDTPDDFREFCEENQDTDPVYRVPVYLFDHSGLTVNTTGFSCPWDSGQVGWCWIQRSQAVEWGWFTDPESIEEILRDTVALLDDYLTGNVYGYVVIDDNGQEIDSCWGFFGDPAKSGCLDEAKVAAESHAKEAAKQASESMEYAI